MSEWKNELVPHFSYCVVELSGSDDHLHLKDIAFGHAPLHQTLQHLLLVQPDISEKNTAGVWENTAACMYMCLLKLSCTYLNRGLHATYLKLPVRSEAPGLNNTWVRKLAPRLWTRQGGRRKKRKLNLSLLHVVFRVNARWMLEDCILLLTCIYLMSFLRRSQPYTPPSPWYRVPDTRS